MGAKHSQEAIQQFMLAVARNDKKYVSGRINAGFKINARDMVGQTASHWAAYRGNVEILELLASKNARLDRPFSVLCFLYLSVYIYIWIYSY